MAGKIKGITIEIDGDTSKLGKALKDVEAKSRDTNKSLREIEKSLKFNPGNTELVTQQQRKLKDAINETKEKLNILKEADKQAKEQLANGKLGQDAYDELQREILKTKNDLETYEKRLASSKDEQSKLKDNIQALKEKMKETGKTTDDLAELMGKDFVSSLEKGEGSSEDVEKAIRELSLSMEEGRENAKKLEGSFVNFDAITNVFGKIKDAAVGAFNAISDAWSEVDDALDTIVSKTGASGDVFDNLKQQYKDLYSTLPVDAKVVGDAIGEVNTLFGLQGDVLEDATEKILKYSEINGTDVTSSTQQARKAIDQFNLSTDSLGNVLDIVTKAGHDTGNTSYGANAQAHANLQSRQVLDYGWHWQVDDKEAIQSFKHEYRIFCQGDGYNGIGNNQAVSVEICINRDGNYKQAVTNGARLVAKIMKDEKIGIDQVHQHNFFSGKNCPHEIRRARDGITWLKFKKLVMEFYGGDRKKPVISKTTTNNLYKVTADTLNIRKGPSTSYPITGQIRDRGTYTIVEISKGWGKLKSGAGWIFLGYTKQVNSSTTKAKKTITQLAEEVIKGDWGNGDERKKRLSQAGYDPVKVQAEVNRIL
ncbi:MAG: SH3 domain-containing protein [Tissierellia bacterium]|nr:SH3 domain-containing protein [Tissierellia bacterium]